ncbi:GntR family transcriptional regulator [Treponema putidum]|uniref:GntR family transcriptional regulator n=1 Tax=Treponema putidum TaxID=221027 RepID=A0AAE9MVT9_9SPIR|nr:GntR family transcriptional regulator [Treponema putidum]AIN93446.1 transcriptional regulator [Treponema putidum]TWI73103.1 GntR family transcriptional regulator [Treponema putidum]UTY32161.1 GntR family transcriptional regulator [Treponema putidum]UTY34550.1 GntR family transcriptional regulator [Treponema putidum]
MKVIYDQNRPIYLQIVEKIKCKIVYGELKPGDKIPSMSDMSAEMDVNPNTMFRVYKQLESEGITESKRGLGSFVVNEADLVKKLTEEMADQIILPAIEGLRNLKFSNEQIMASIKAKIE